jgi:arginyl-tRNA synthetase
MNCGRGDYSTNVALKVGALLKKDPKSIVASILPFLQSLPVPEGLPRVRSSVA